MTPQELKNSILHLAIQGKLVEQVNSDIPVDLSIYKTKQTENPEFEIPEKWQIAHLECVTNSVPSKQYQILESQVKKEGLYPVISQSKEYIIGYSSEKTKLFRHSEPVIVFGDHTTEVKLVAFDFIVAADGVKIFAPKACLLPSFFFYVMQYFCIDLNKVGGYSRHYKYIKNKPIPIPPLAEQKRIVAKIEELLPLIDRYEEAWTKLENFNKRFPEDMQKSILQMAIQGKLVPQDPSEGTGEELYNKIKTEDVVENGVRKKGRGKITIVPVEDSDIPFEIPESWKWVRLGTIGFTNIGLTYNPKDISNEGTIVLRSSNIQNGHMDYTDIVKVRIEVPESKMCRKGDILICARNGSKKLVGKAAIIDADGMSFGAFMAILRSKCNGFIYHVISSAYFRNSLLGDTGTTTINQITQEMLKNVLIPLPPLAEQKRIVTKLEELLPLCEKLKKVK